MVAGAAAVRILGVDPGTAVVGLACLEMQPRQRAAVARRTALRAANVVAPRAIRSGPVTLVDARAVRLDRGRAPIATRLARLAEALEEWFARYRPDVVALEEAFAGKSVRAALRIGEARGVVLAQAHRSGLPVHEYTPARVKRCVAGHGGADKEAVAAFALRRLGLGPLDGPRDASDAVAVALCHLEHGAGPP